VVAIVCIAGLFVVTSPAGASYTIVDYPTVTPNDTPGGIALGSDGNMWFTEGQGAIGRITPAGKVTEFPTGVADSIPEGITAGPDGNLWFADAGAGKIGRITTSGKVTEFAVPTAGAQPEDITAGPDGKLWFTESSTYRVGSITTAGVVKEYLVGANPAGITAGPDNNLWFTETQLGNIGRITTSGVVTTFPIGVANSNPQEITAGPDNNLWFTDPGTQSIGQITTSGSVTEFPITTPVSAPLGIASGPDGNLWFTESNTNQIGQMATSGTMLSETPIPTSISEPWRIAPGYGGMWFTEWNASRIGQLRFPTRSFFNVYYIPNRFFIPNEGRLAAQGETVTWESLNPGTHAVVDSSGMRLFGYNGPNGVVPLAIGQSFSFTFDWAGTYSYHDPYLATATGSVQVPIVAQRVAGTTDEAQVTWASHDAPAGFAFDVQVKAPRSNKWTSWLTRTTALGSGFGPSLRQWKGTGTYQFRSGLVDEENGTGSGYSPSAKISLH